MEDGHLRIPIPYEDSHIVITNFTSPDKKYVAHLPNGKTVDIVYSRFRSELVWRIDNVRVYWEGNRMKRISVKQAYV